MGGPLEWSPWKLKGGGIPKGIKVLAESNWDSPGGGKGGTAPGIGGGKPGGKSGLIGGGGAPANMAAAIAAAMSCEECGRMDKWGGGSPGANWSTMNIVSLIGSYEAIWDAY